MVTMRAPSGELVEVSAGDVTYYISMGYVPITDVNPSETSPSGEQVQPPLGGEGLPLPSDLYVVGGTAYGNFGEYNPYELAQINEILPGDRTQEQQQLWSDFNAVGGWDAFKLNLRDYASTTPPGQPGWAHEMFPSSGFVQGEAVPNWVSYLDIRMRSLFGLAAQIEGASEAAYMTLYDTNAGDMMEHVWGALLHPEQNMQTPEELERVVSLAHHFLAQRYPHLGIGKAILQARWPQGFQWENGRLVPQADRTTGGGGGGYGGGMSAGNFDLAQLASGVVGLWRSVLWEEPDDPRGIARAYRDERLANPMQALDFETWVRNRMKGTARYQALYGAKPEALSEEQFMAPYYSMALQWLAPDDAVRTTLRGAMLGATPEGFQARLAKDPSVMRTAPFIARLESRLDRMRGVLRG